jgi:ribonuclease Z
MFDLTFLGTAASTPSSDRGLPALLVGVGSERFLVDCGEGTTRQMLRAGSGFRRLGHVLLTHDDLDHVLGLGGLIATLDLLDRRAELAICGSRETIRFVEGYLSSLWPQGYTPLPLRFVALTPGLVTAESSYRIACFPVRHRGTVSLGYRFEIAAHRHLLPDRLAAFGVPAGPLRAQLAAGGAVVLADGRHIDPIAVQGLPVPGASLAVVGDAEETRSLVPAIRGADALVIEATFLEADAALAAERGHLTAAQAGRLAAEAGIGALYLTHLSGRYDPAAVKAEAGRFFPNVSVMNDLDRVTVVAAARDRVP